MKCFRVFLLAIVLISACIGGGSDDSGVTQDKVWVTPCNVIGTGIQIRIVGTSLENKQIKAELEPNFVDDFTSPWGVDMQWTHTLTCYWGKKKGERPEYYYCGGQYKAVELNPSGEIKRWLLKEYKIGFDVEQHEIGTWVDLTGKKHVEETFYYLTTKDIITQCSVTKAPTEKEKAKAKKAAKKK